MRGAKRGGKTKPGPGDRQRAQVAYEGDDEFSLMSLDPRRQRRVVELGPRPAVGKVDQLSPVRTVEGGVISFFRKIFDK